MSYITNDFLLTTESGRKLYHDVAEKMPIIDYHCHLSEKQILENKPFQDVYEVWLDGDHYKWRLMRNFGISEEYITGNKSHKEKFLAYCKTLSKAFGNPLYHWSQSEIEFYFDCHLEINEKNAEKIWEECNAYIASHEVTPQSLIEKSNVTHVFTTNEAFDDLTIFEKIKAKNYKFTVLPAYRTDKFLHIEHAMFMEYVGKLGKIESLKELLNVLEEKLKDFIKIGAKAADMSLEGVYPVTDFETAEKVFEKKKAGKTITAEEAIAYKGYMTYFFFTLYGKYHLVSELHVGPMRNNNTRMFETLGPDTGFDTIAEDNTIKNMSRLFDKLDYEGLLPKTIVFNLNPIMNMEILTLLGAFQSDEAKGKMQYGPAWWFLDHKEGMEKQLKDLMSVDHIDTFVGMLTDSRSLLSYPRHFYFRRIFCNLIGSMMDHGEMTKDFDLVKEVVENVCYHNAIQYFGV